MKIDCSMFSPISLSEMEEVKLMNRTDEKYWFNIEKLKAVLEEVKDSYYMLSIDDQRLIPYSTTYYDTESNQMFVSHHNGKLNRFKVRRRQYVMSDISFLEVKQKNNKGRTIKKRIPSASDNNTFTNEELEFLEGQVPYSVMDLHVSLINNFSRITLVNKNFSERCTIDLGLRFTANGHSKSFDDLVIVEVKADGRAKLSPLQLALREHRIRPAGFSKYCIGRTVTDATLKRNSFKQKIRSIEKTIHTETSLFASA